MNVLLLCPSLLKADIRHYQDYCEIREKYGIDVYLFFVDEVEKKVYGGLLRYLEIVSQVANNGSLIEYPFRHKGKIYFPLHLMRDFVGLSDEEVEKLKGLSTRSDKYEKAYSGLTP